MPRRIELSIRVLPILIPFCLGLIAAFGISAMRQESGTIGSKLSSPRTIAAVTGGTGHASQLVLVLIGTKRLGAKDAKGAISAFQSLRDSVRRMATSHALPLVVIGASVDQSPDDGLRWLKLVGGFDEVVTGQGWLGLAAERFIWSDTAVQARIPQVRILLRSVAADRTSVKLLAERSLHSFVGYPSWIQSQKELGSLEAALLLALEARPVGVSRW